jgi:hypothetical protein
MTLKMMLSFSPTSHDFGDMQEGQTDRTTFEIWNSGSGTLEYRLKPCCEWTMVTPRDGTSTGEYDTITVTIETVAISSSLTTFRYGKTKQFFRKQKNCYRGKRNILS